MTKSGVLMAATVASATAIAASSSSSSSNLFVNSNTQFTNQAMVSRDDRDMSSTAASTDKFKPRSHSNFKACVQEHPQFISFIKYSTKSGERKLRFESP
ncbi:hypothetical protein GIB67_037980 [Kingdonia uniflora]|uniref:Uncharacterized protein n=1 Tax=Kingdonia uniflora TaxID=39325 RepID=A0A7J7LHF2_9MAGN|nr:hypothetical protein GIB67_037980 [Kingdonia uniflora]